MSVLILSLMAVGSLARDLVFIDALSASSSISSIGVSIRPVLSALYDLSQFSRFSRILLFFLTTTRTGSLKAFNLNPSVFISELLKSLVFDVKTPAILRRSSMPTPTSRLIRCCESNPELSSPTKPASRRSWLRWTWRGKSWSCE